jgi:hypothetical protein
MPKINSSSVKNCESSRLRLAQKFSIVTRAVVFRLRVGADVLCWCVFAPIASPLVFINRVVLTPQNGWMRSGCAMDAQRMRSGCAAGAQRARSVTTAVVEAEKDRCANDAAPKSPQDSADAPPPPLARNLCEIGVKSRKSPQFFPSSLPCRN